MRWEAGYLTTQHHIPEYPNPQNSHYFMIYLENTITQTSPQSLICIYRTKIPYSFFDWCIYGVFFDHDVTFHLSGDIVLSDNIH